MPAMSAPAPHHHVHYTRDYFAAQLRKSDAKVAWQYGRIFALAGLCPRGRVLDVGCGAGPGLRYLETTGAQAVGLDLVYYPLAEARQLALSTPLVQADVARGLPFASASFDVLLLSELLEHLPEGGALLAECWRVARPGGYLVVTTPNLWDMRRFLSPLVGKTWVGYTDPTHINLYTPLRLAREMRAAGFRQVRWRTGVKPIVWLSSRRLRLRMSVPYPPSVGSGLVAVGMRPETPA
jgi:2-polyprenyl-3-methyl-5-hydroxy-6-metoxy-1,4-benzoquinol methylase